MLDTFGGNLYEAGKPVQPSAVRCVWHLVKAGVVRLERDGLSDKEEIDRPLYRLYQNFPLSG